MVKGSELYDMRNDWSQETDVADQHPEIVAHLRRALEDKWGSLQPNLFDIQRIIIGNDAENPMELTGFDWAGGKAVINQGGVLKGPNKNGHWELTVDRAGEYEFSLSRWPGELGVPLSGVPDVGHEPVALPIAKARIKIGDLDESSDVSPTDSSVSFRARLPKGDVQLYTWFYDNAGRELCGAYYVVVRRL
jgi:hypothetical protein